MHSAACYGTVCVCPSVCLSANTVIGTLAVYGWAVTFGTAMRGLDGLRPAQSPPRCTKCNSPLINGQCTNFIWFDVALELPLHSKRSTRVRKPVARVYNYRVHHFPSKSKFQLTAVSRWNPRPGLRCTEPWSLWGLTRSHHRLTLQHQQHIIIIIITHRLTALQR